MKSYILALDQGTTSSRAVIFDAAGAAVASAQAELPQYFPRNGWVEHDPEDLWTTSLDSCIGALRQAGLRAADLAGIGITNQRETTLVWERATGTPVCKAIVWQDRRTSEAWRRLDAAALEADIQRRTGLILNPYFSAGKLQWILEQVPGARERAERGELAFGTVDSWLLWRLTGGRSHLTDVTNASRTLLFNIRTMDWDDELLALFGIPRALLPEVRDCCAEFGLTEAHLLGDAVPVRGMAGDQQAASFGQCCFERGTAKSTYGTGCFLLINTGAQPVVSAKRLLATVAWRLDGASTYALEGSIFSAGATLQWLRDGLRLIGQAAESEALARETPDDLAVYLVPAFTGLGAPYWDSAARGALFGLTRDTGIREVVTAALQAVCFQTRDLMDAMAADGVALNALRVDGGMVVNDVFMQTLADVLACPVERPAVPETTALGAARLAGLQAGVFSSLAEIAGHWRRDRRFQPRRDEAWREARYAGWLDAVRRTRVDG